MIMWDQLVSTDGITVGVGAGADLRWEEGGDWKNGSGLVEERRKESDVVEGKTYVQSRTRS